MTTSFVCRLLLAVVALPLLLGGCSDDDPDPPVPDPTTPPPSATSTAEPWEERSDEGAIAFAEHWFGLFNDARLQFDTEPLAEASHLGCATCSNFVNTIDTWRSKGTTYESRPWEVRQAKVVDMHQDTADLDLLLWRPAETIKYVRGKKERNDGSRGTHRATLTWSDGAWKMQELVIDE